MINSNQFLFKSIHPFKQKSIARQGSARLTTLRVMLRYKSINYAIRVIFNCQFKIYFKYCWKKSTILANGMTLSLPPS